MAVGNRFSTVGKVLYSQALMVVVITMIFLWVGGWKSALSPMLGGGIALVPNLFFAFKVYLARNLQAQDMVNAFYVGETIKLLLTAALFTIVLQFPSIDFVRLLIGYIAVLSVFWFALIYWRD
jgi:ATP synthase protein I